MTRAAQLVVTGQLFVERAAMALRAAIQFHDVASQARARKRRTRRRAWRPPVGHQLGDQYRAGRRIWSVADDVELRRTYPHESTAAIARRMRRTLTATYAHAQLLGLEKSEAYLASPEACRLRRGDNPGIPFRFQKGHVPANKGLRRPGYSVGRGRMQETQFKPGMRSGKAAEHYMPIGSTRIVEGYVYRKVADVPNVPYTVNWKPEHHLIWTKAHGPIPTGHALSFLNGDRRDIRLENLELITRRELMARNTVHNLPPELAKTVQLLGALNRKIRRRTTDAEEHDRGLEEPPVRDARGPEGQGRAHGPRSRPRRRGRRQEHHRVGEGRGAVSERHRRRAEHRLHASA